MMVHDEVDLAPALLTIVPKLLLRLGADLSFENFKDDETEWREIVELRATPGQLTLLRVLVEHGRCTMQELAEHLGVTPSTATAMIKRLVAQRYVERSRDENDWRSVWVSATETGKRAVFVFDQARQRSLDHRLKFLSDEERKMIWAALPALKHLIEVQP